MKFRFRSQGARYLCLATLLFTFACAGRSTGQSDAGEAPAVEYPPSGSVGSCVELETRRGVKHCLLSEPQTNVENGGKAASSSQALGNLPAKVDHRSYLVPNCPKVPDQNPCGWCVAFAVSAALEALACEQKPAEAMSPSHLWAIGNGGEVDNCEGGWWIEAAAFLASTNYILTAEDWSFAGRNTKPPESIRQYCGQYMHAYQWQMVPSSDVDALRAAIADGLNVAYTVPVYERQGWTWQDAQVGKIVFPDDGVPLIGYHAILVVGYDDTLGQFIFRNSWGTNWGDQGYGTLSYDFIRSYGQGGQAPRQLAPPPEGMPLRLCAGGRGSIA